MNRKTLIHRITASVLMISMLLSLGACGQSPAQTGASSSARESTAKAETTSPAKESTTAHVSPGVVKAGNLTEEITADPVSGKDADETFTLSQYRFAAEIFRRSYAADQGNCLVSPLSIVLALAMTANGAENETLRQMLDVLGNGMSMEDLNAYLYAYVKSLPSSVQARLAIADSLWINDKEDFSVREDFLKKTVSWYHSSIYRLPFDPAAVAEVNGWVAKQTDDMITEVIQDLDEDARMLLINALCFDAKWASPYADYSVQQADFTKADGSKQTVDMMYSSENDYYKGNGYTGFAKYYDGAGYKFVAILPDEGVSLDDFVASLDGEKLSSVLSRVAHTKVNAGLPKFSYDYSASLKARLQDMGMVNAFVSDTSRPDFADFSGMSEDTPLFIGDVIHKTFIEVCEAGTRAAAVTVVEVMGATAIMEPPKEVILDRPFLYMIVDCETELPIFIGTVNEISK